jgi:hypothetical protein
MLAFLTGRREGGIVFEHADNMSAQLIVFSVFRPTTLT